MKINVGGCFEVVVVVGRVELLVVVVENKSCSKLRFCC